VKVDAAAVAAVNLLAQHGGAVIHAGQLEGAPADVGVRRPDAWAGYTYSCTDGGEKLRGDARAAARHEACDGKRDEQPVEQRHRDELV
jgi:hypothetical protein